jgi:hypothetical protein
VEEEPQLTNQGAGQRAACHFPLEGSIIGEAEGEERSVDAIVEMQEELRQGEDSASS